MDPLATIDLNLLLSLHHLLDSASVQTAAAELGVGQPAMSASLAKLRALLQDPLLIRTGRSMRRTDRAEALRQPVAELVDQARGVLSPVAPFDPARDEWTARVAISDETRVWLGPRLVARTRAVAPRVDLRLRRLTPDSPGAGRTGAIDLAVFPDPMGIPSGSAPDLSAFVIRPLYTVRFVVASRRSPSADEGWTPQSYARADHVLVVGWEESDRGFADEALAALGLSRRIAVTVPTAAEAIALVRQDPTLVTLLPEMLVSGTGLGAWALPWGERSVQICYAFHPRTARDPRLRWLRSVLEAAVAEELPNVGDGRANVGREVASIGTRGAAAAGGEDL